jgi:lysophospholipase L1-like esterase
MKIFPLILSAAAAFAQFAPVPFNPDLRLGKTYRVALMGDSFAAGEGAPNRTGALWNSDPCHRSNENGRSAALRRLQTDIANSVGIVPEQLQFLDVACSGATINGNVLGENYRGVTPLTRTGPGPVGNPIPSQVTQIKNWLNGAELDALVISIGGNDIGFGSVVVKCMTPLTSCKEDEALETLIRRGRFGDSETVGLDFLPGAFQTMKNRFDSELKPKAVFVVGVPNPLRDQDGRYCDRYNDGVGIMPTNLADPLNSPYAVFVGYTLGVVSPTEFDRDEAKWVEDTMINPLNATLQQIVQGFSASNWHFIGHDFMHRYHGLCATKSWYNTFKTSLESQGDFNGIAHPNREGYKVYDAFVYRALVRHFGRRVRTQPRIDHENFHIAYTINGTSKIMPPSEFNLNGDRLFIGDNWSIKFRTLVFPAADRIESLTLQVSTRPFDEAIAADIRSFTMDVASQQVGNFDRNVSTAQYPGGQVLHVRWRAVTRPYWDAAGTPVTRFSTTIRVKVKDGLDSAKRL